VEKIESVEAYFAGLDDRTRTAIRKVHDAILAAVPEAEEAVVYGMPGFRLHGKSFVGYMAFKDHYSVFPMGGDAIEAHRAELGDHVTGKGTISFSYDERFPAGLVKKVAKTRAAMIDAKR
jgi:uncharacterized protein YdhG (YjbR/CyaY superfamily)